jgi:hypothetical protein
MRWRVGVRGCQDNGAIFSFCQDFSGGGFGTVVAEANFDNTNLGVYVHDGSPPYSDTGQLFYNDSPLFTGGVGSGESEMRRCVSENDLLAAIIGLPTDRFYN